jgi:hypothetical protein
MSWTTAMRCKGSAVSARSSVERARLKVDYQEVHPAWAVAIALEIERAYGRRAETWAAAMDLERRRVELAGSLGLWVA